MWGTERSKGVCERRKHSQRQCGERLTHPHTVIEFRGIFVVHLFVAAQNEQFLRYVSQQTARGKDFAFRQLVRVTKAVDYAPEHQGTSTMGKSLPAKNRQSPELRPELQNLGFKACICDLLRTLSEDVSRQPVKRQRISQRLAKSALRMQR